MYVYTVCTPLHSVCVTLKIVKVVTKNGDKQIHKNALQSVIKHWKSSKTVIYNATSLLIVCWYEAVEHI